MTFLLNVLQIEKDVFTQICLLESLYKLGAKEYLYKLAKKINVKKISNRHAVINALYGIVDDDNREFIKAVLASRKEKERISSVTSKIDDVLSLISLSCGQV